MAKPTYKLIDAKGRVLIPFDLRAKAEMENGDIIKLTVDGPNIILSKVDIVEAGKQDAESVDTFIHAAAKTMDVDRQVAVASRILKLAENNKKGE